MKKLVIALGIMILSSTAFGISNAQLRTIMEKEVASVDDAIALVSEVSKTELQANEVIKKLDPKDGLNIGRLGMILIEAEQVKGGVFYKIFRNQRYAAHSLVYNKIVAPTFSWNRKVSGIELIEFFSASQPGSEDNEE